MLDSVLDSVFDSVLDSEERGLPVNTKPESLYFPMNSWRLLLSIISLYFGSSRAIYSAESLKDRTLPHTGSDSHPNHFQVEEIPSVASSEETLPL